MIDFHCFLAMAVFHPFSITAHTLNIQIITPYLQLYASKIHAKLLTLILAKFFFTTILCYFFGLNIFHLNARLSVFGSEKIHFCRMRMMVLDDNLMTGQHD